MRTFGVEEEFQFLDPETLRPANVGAAVFERLSREPDWAGVTHKEFLASQVEHASSVFTRLDDARAAGITQLVATVCGDNPRVVALLKRLGDSLSESWQGREREFLVGLGP